MKAIRLRRFTQKRRNQLSKSPIYAATVPVTLHREIDWTTKDVLFLVALIALIVFFAFIIH